jgi:hypothetical protein
MGGPLRDLLVKHTITVTKASLYIAHAMKLEEAFGQIQTLQNAQDSTRHPAGNLHAACLKQLLC